MKFSLVQVLVVFCVLHNLVECSLWNQQRRNQQPQVQYHYHGNPCESCPCQKTFNAQFVEPVKDEIW
jgi:hypothetical protein